MSESKPIPHTAASSTNAVIDPSVPRTFDHALHPAGWWRGLVAIVSLCVVYLIVSLILGALAAFADVATGRYTFEELAAGEITLTPFTLLAVNISAAALIPLSIGLQALLFGRRPGTLSSVIGRFRWRWLGRLSLVLAPLFIVYVVATLLVQPPQDVAVTGSALFFLAVVSLTTPFQAAGEEYGARGLIQRSAGSWVAHPAAAFAVSTAVSAVIFALAHFAADPWLIAYYLVFGVAMSIAARGTGGLEAPVLIHALNNVLLFASVAFSGEIAIDRSVGVGGPFMILPMLVVLGAAFLAVWWGRRHAAEVATAPMPADPRA